MERIKRILAIMLVLTMIFSLGETMVFASEVPADTSSEVQADGTASNDENVIPGDTEEDVDPGAMGGDSGAVTAPEGEDDEAPPPDGEPSAPPADTGTEGTEPTETPDPSAEPAATPEPSAEPTATPEPTAAPAPVHKEWPWAEPGNDVSQLLGGGRYLTVGGSMYYSENGGLYLDDALLASVDAKNLNLCGDTLYYTCGNTVYRMPSGGGAAEEVYTAEGAIELMYVMGEEIRFLSGGVVYSYDMSWTEAPAPAEEPAPADGPPAPDAEQDVPPEDTADETDDAQQEDNGAAPAAALPGGGLSLDMEDLGLEPSETETEIVTGAETETAQPAGPLETLEGPAGILAFIPTPYGNLFLTGEYFNYTLWTATAQLLTGINSCYPDGDWLVVYTTGGETMQTSLAGLFEGAVSLQEYSLHQDMYYNEGASEEEILAEQSEYFASDEYAAILDGRETNENDGIMTVGIMPIANPASGLTTNQRNIVLRARQMAEVTWTPLKDVCAWGGNEPGYVTESAGKNKKVYKGDGGWFRAGKTYMGVPYSQPVNTNGWVGYDLSLNKFLAEVNSSGSRLYSTNSDFSRTAPTFGNDCSTFVSWAWGLSSRRVCSTLVDCSYSIGSNSYTKLQVGDILNNPYSHVMLVTNIWYSGSEITAVEITEQTPPMMTVSIYGTDYDTSKSYDYTLSLSYLQEHYLNQGYTIYRRNANLSAVPLPETVQNIGSVATPSMTVTPEGAGAATVSFSCATEGAVIYYTEDGTQPDASSPTYSSPISVNSDDLRKTAGKTIEYQAVAVKGDLTSSTMYGEVDLSVQPRLTLYENGSAAPVSGEGSNKVYCVPKGTELSMKAALDATIYYTVVEGSGGYKFPTLESDHVDTASGKVKIPFNSEEMTIMAFAAAPGDVPSEVVEFKVKNEKLWTVELDDPFGFLTVEGATVAEDETNHLMESAMYVKGSDTIKVTVKDTVKLDEDSETKMTLTGIEVTRGKTAKKEDVPKNGTLEIKKVETDLKITAEVATSFEDIKGQNVDNKYAWYTNAAEYCKQHGLINGDTKNNFNPNDHVLREQFIAILCRMYGPELELASGEKFETQKDWEPAVVKGEPYPFPQLAVTVGSDIAVREAAGTDAKKVGTLDASGIYMTMDKSKTAVPGGDTWYYVQYADGLWGYVANKYSSVTLVQACTFNDFVYDQSMYAYGYAQWAYLRGIVSGTKPNAFSPRAKINREDLCCLLYKFLTSLGITMDTSDRLGEFPDGTSVSKFARDAVNAMVNAGIINGRPGSDGKNYICPRGRGPSDDDADGYPQGFASRADTAVLFMRLDKYLKGENLSANAGE